MKTIGRTISEMIFFFVFKTHDFPLLRVLKVQQIFFFEKK
jgi:hypothetical protein